MTMPLETLVICEFSCTLFGLLQVKIESAYVPNIRCSESFENLLRCPRTGTLK